MFTYKAKSVFTMGGLFDSEFSPAAGTCSIFADSLESEECAVMVHGMEDGKVAIGGQLFPKLIDWYQLPIYLKKRMPNLKKVYLLSCFNGVRRSMLINDVKLIIPKQTRVNRPISMSRACKFRDKYFVCASGSKVTLALATIGTFCMGIFVYSKMYGVKLATKAISKLCKDTWTKYILA